MSSLEKFKNSAEFDKFLFPAELIYEWVKTGKITLKELQNYVKSVIFAAS